MRTTPLGSELSNRGRTGAAAVFTWLLLLAAPLLIASDARADAKAAPPRFVVVNQDRTPMKCSGGAPFYAVRTLDPGQVLRVDGEETGWLRVEYLAGMLAYVRAEEVELDAGAKTLRLIRPSRLFAVNERTGDRANWWNLLEQELPVGTVLQLNETVKGMDEVTRGYLVTAPAQARAYVRADAVRPALEVEASSYKGRTDLAAISTAKPAVPGADGASSPGQQAPAKLEVAEGKAATPGPAPVEAAPIIYDAKTLLSRFEQTLVLDGEEAEKQIPVVVADIRRKIASLGLDPAEQRLAIVLDQRLRALQLRLDLALATKRIASVESKLAAPTAR